MMTNRTGLAEKERECGPAASIARRRRSGITASTRPPWTLAVPPAVPLAGARLLLTHPCHSPKSVSRQGDRYQDRSAKERGQRGGGSVFRGRLQDDVEVRHAERSGETVLGGLFGV